MTRSMLLPMVQEGGAAASSSLVKILLRLPFLQPALLKLLLETLSCLDTADDGASSLIKLILSQIRWLDNVYDPSGLTETMLEIVSVCDKSLKLDLISILPDVIPDSAADEAVTKLLEVRRYFISRDLKVVPNLTRCSSFPSSFLARRLLQLKETDPTLLLPILDAVSSLRLSPASLHSITFETLSSLGAAEPAR